MLLALNTDKERFLFSILNFFFSLKIHYQQAKLPIILNNWHQTEFKTN